MVYQIFVQKSNLVKIKFCSKIEILSKIDSSLKIEILVINRIFLVTSKFCRCMFVTDRPLKSKGKTDLKLIEFNSTKHNYSLVSEESVGKIELIEATMCRDPGHRGIQHLIMPGHLLNAVTALSHAKSILLTTGEKSVFKYYLHDAVFYTKILNKFFTAKILHFYSKNLHFYRITISS